MYDLTGMQFGKLYVLGRTIDKYRVGSSPTFLCLCDCGEKEAILSYQLRKGFRAACRKCIPLRKVGLVLGSKCKYSSRVHEKPLTKKQIRGYRKKLKDPGYIEEAIEGAAMNMTNIFFALILRDKYDERKWKLK